jgi:very-short-patch-repair endonuclease
MDLPVFRRQHPVGPFVLDFYCSDASLCIEVDGGWHHVGGRPERDKRRDAWLAEQGIAVVRIPASKVLDDPESVVIWIRELARERKGANRKL